ncbi:MAG TPA: amidohydrolase [candidate division Zixibacteria bacterium]|nr:amidohydrolase [candidate division Zixibacteria bacterium]
MRKSNQNLVFKNGAIYTVDQGRNWVEAMAISGGRIVYTGANQGLGPYLGPDMVVVDLEGKMVLPGFVDAHAHPSHAMDLVSNISLYGLDSVEEYRDEIAGYVASHEAAEVIRGSGWDNRFFSSRGPDKAILDALVPDRPVSLISYDGHSVWVNSITLERAQITGETPDPEGGYIERDPDTGEPNGTLRETAMLLVEKVIPDYSIAERKHALLAYQEMAARAGVTLSHDAMLEAPAIAAFRELADEGLLTMRFRGSLLMEPDRDVAKQVASVVEERSHDSHPYFQVSAAKIFVDGVIEGGTAYLHAEYKHKPGFRGEPIWDPQILNTMSAALDSAQVQIHVHVIGDAATEITLDALQYTREKNGGRDSRHLITHLQLVAPEDLPRFKQLGVIGVPQPFWFKVDDYYRKLALPYLGKERADAQYPMKSFIDSGVIMASSSDFPVTIPFAPLIGIQRGITRSETGRESEEVLWSEERVSLEEMIASFTYNGAYANFLEDETGSLEVGKQADGVVLDRNIFDLPPSEISETKVLLTLVEGNVVFKDEDFDQDI